VVEGPKHGLVEAQAHGQALKILVGGALKKRGVAAEGRNGQLVAVLHHVDQKMGREQQMIAKTVEILRKNDHKKGPRPAPEVR